MARDIAEWLDSLGFGRYADGFADNEIDLDALPHITEADLKDIGVALGPRRKMLAAIAELGDANGAVGAANADERSDQNVPGADAERRQLTVMFVDLVGSTSLSAGLDPEEMRDIIRGFQDAVAGEIARLDGHVAKFMGDGVLVYFGWPQAHENEAERAVRAGLAVMKAIERLHAPDGAPLTARIGIATGLVVVGDLIGEGSAREETVVGDTPNLAARLQALAQPGQVLVAEATKGLLGGLFELNDLGRHEVKGLAEPVAVYAVLSERTLESRFAARGSADLSEIVGRDQELALLLERWGQACDREGQMVLLSGEAGIGKSRITEALIDEVRGMDHTTIRYQCSPYHTDSALYPATQQLSLAAGFERGDDTATRLDKLEALLGLGTTDVAAQAPLIAPLLEIDSEARYGAPRLSPQQLRSRTLQALIDQLIGLAQARPVLFVIEDAHWIDPTTLELMELALDTVARSRVLLLVTARPTFEHGFGGHPVVTRLMLNRLGQSQTVAIARRVSGGKALPEALLDEIAAKTDGVPLFVEEIAKAVLESGVLREEKDAYVLTGPLSALAIPATLHDSLMARLDRLRPVKEVAQLAAVIGRSFDYRTLAAIASQPDDELASALDGLVAAELVFRRGAPPEADYLFKHALVRDAAYESLLKSRRQAIHAALLDVLEAQDDAQPEILAHHAEEAGATDKAVDYWTRAGNIAVGRPAYREARSHFDNALRLVRGEPNGQIDKERELQLLLRLNHANMAGLGYAHPVTVEGLAEARRLVDAIGGSPLRFPIYYGIWVMHHVRGEHTNGLEIAEEMVEATTGDPDPEHEFMASRSFCLSHVMTGAFDVGEADFKRAVALYDPDRDRALTWQYGQSPYLGLLCYRAIGLACRGFPVRAWNEAKDVPERAEQLGHTNTQAYSYLHVAILAQILRNHTLAEDVSRHAIRLSDEHGMQQWKAMATLALASALSQSGKPDEAVELMEEGRAPALATNSRVFMAYLLAHHVGSLVALGRLERATELRSEIIAIMEKRTESWANAEIHRMLADAQRLVPGEEEAAEKGYLQALAIARDQNAKLWELRTATSLARLLRHQGKTGKASDLLTPVYGWFTEGFETPDLVEAKVLMDELS